MCPYVASPRGSGVPRQLHRRSATAPRNQDRTCDVQFLLRPPGLPISSFMRVKWHEMLAQVKLLQGTLEGTLQASRLLEASLKADMSIQHATPFSMQLLSPRSGIGFAAFEGHRAALLQLHGCVSSAETPAGGGPERVCEANVSPSSWIEASTTSLMASFQSFGHEVSKWLSSFSSGNMI